MLEALVGDVAEEMVAQMGENTTASVQNHPFLVEASNHKLFDSTTQGLTIFLPLDFVKIDDHDDEFLEFFNRHVVRGIVRVGGEGVQQLTTLSKVTIAIYPLDESTHAVAGVALDSSLMNMQLHGCYVHSFEASTLPQLRPFGDAIASVRAMYLSGESIELPFEALGIEDSGSTHTYTLIASFNLPDRTVIGEAQMIPWIGNGTLCRLVVPNVTIRTSVVLWIQLYDNNYRQVIMTMMWSWCLMLLPNVNMHPNPRITAVIPKTARANEELCILGTNFKARDLRVSIGPQPAHVFYCDASTIRCFVPTGSDIQPVWVANGNVYTRFDYFQYAA